MLGLLSWPCAYQPYAKTPQSEMIGVCWLLALIWPSVELEHQVAVVREDFSV
jgi:hypothetical protein